jgi:hypothetical protein
MRLASSREVTDVADLLSHVLIAYALFTVASWLIGPLTGRWVAIGMGGAAIPDLVKLDLVLDARLIEQALNLPFSYAPISSLAGVLLLAGVITLLFAHERRRVYTLLVTGGLLLLLVDGLRAYADGHASFWLYPLWWRPPTPSLYVTSDSRVLASTLAVATVVALADRVVIDTAAGTP